MDYQWRLDVPLLGDLPVTMRGWSQRMRQRLFLRVLQGIARRRLADTLPPGRKRYPGSPS